jgi:tRNA(fMet)-specific endonuclease VapC
MTLLDTDHLSILSDPRSTKRAALESRLAASTDQGLAATIVTIEEHWRGWLALLKRLGQPRRQIPGYHRMMYFIEFLKRWRVVPFDDECADEFERLRREGIRIGTQDLKIASIALVQDALLLSANLRDFRKVPGLRVESWID